MKKARILIVDDEHLIRWSLEKDLSQAGYDTRQAASGEEALAMIEENEPDVVLLDLRMPGIDGFEVMERSVKKDMHPLFIIVTGTADVKTAVRAVKEGAVDYICKPFDIEDVKLRIEMAMETARVRRELSTLKDELKTLYGFENIVGDSPVMKEVFATVEKVAASKFTTVLLQGESGTGKDLIARTIHSLSDRAQAVFLDINCSAFPETLLESELFGHERGAFTGARSTKKGLFELADGGTIYLDEIGDMPLTLQGKLLKAIETKRFRRVGGTVEIQVEVRIIAATNKNLQAEVNAQRFRNDLFYRLRVIPIHIPPLRERTEDIPGLVEFFLARFNADLKKDVKGISQEALKLLKNYPWPGNVRELKNIIERVLILETSETIEAENLPPEITNYSHASPAEKVVEHFPAEGLSLREVEKDLIAKALAKANGNQSRAAELLGISRDTLRYRMQKFGLK
ncbi:MAG: sigma-54-dependent Fis family transcriptional regulator [Candidatus Abyssobacteria bacterium SURF_17]|uniref:Sigma-54-dependent Fis family transcriptional regulator n=1 Tax=Candidatus Abyssobacteria bacterium SURF_17 TaxID=2093361 RepID=A0A419F2E1_9BACT|nr:MAG: sigma-54-dependent Fis family transcriptional regulator [Candidatus Abyssubacteria bacterium SURF_17]